MPQSTILLKLGTAVKIQTVLSENNPDNVKIEIEDAFQTVKVDYANMTQVAPNTYQYVWQSASTDSEGVYKVTIKATYGSYISYEQSCFELESIDD